MDENEKRLNIKQLEKYNSELEDTNKEVNFYVRPMALKMLFVVLIICGNIVILASDEVKKLIWDALLLILDFMGVHSFFDSVKNSIVYICKKKMERVFLNDRY